jgi:hypothetical protein
MLICSPVIFLVLTFLPCAPAGHAHTSIAIQPAFRLGDHASRIKPAAVTIPRHLMLAADM